MLTSDAVQVMVLGKLLAGLNIFLGRERSAAVVTDVRRALQSAGGLL